MSGNASIVQSEANAVQHLEACGNVEDFGPALTLSQTEGRRKEKRRLTHLQTHSRTHSIFYFRNMLCPGSPAYMHASCQLSASFSSNCNNVIKEITDRVEANKNGTWY